jgi:glycerol-3-phosphate dehydrogenase
VDLAVKKLGRRLPASRTATTPLFGAPRHSLTELGREARHTRGPLSADAAGRLARSYGAAWADVVALVAEDSTLGQTVGRSQTLQAEVVYAVREEMAVRLSDCVFRRTNLAASGNPGEPTLQECARLMAEELGWSMQRQAGELEEVRARFPRLGGVVVHGLA